MPVSNFKPIGRGFAGRVRRADRDGLDRGQDRLAGAAESGGRGGDVLMPQYDATAVTRVFMRHIEAALRAAGEEALGEDSHEIAKLRKATMGGMSFRAAIIRHVSQEAETRGVDLRGSAQ